MMAWDDERFDEQLTERLHAAYEQVALGEAEQERMLGTLRAAQAAHETLGGTSVAGQPTEPVPAPAEPAGQVVPFVARPRRWLVALPVAAALVLALVVVRVSSGAGRSDAAYSVAESLGAKGAEQEAVSEDAAALSENGSWDSIEESADEALTEEGLDAGTATVQDVTQGMPEGQALVTSAAIRPVDGHPCVWMQEGRWLLTWEAGRGPEEVPPEAVGECLGAATAYERADETLQDSVPCTVFALVDDQSAFAVRYEGEQGYWRCVPRDS